MNEEIVWLDLEMESREELITFVGNELRKLGYVSEGYLKAILERESKYPTGLPTVPYPVAIPHTDPQHINKPFVAAVRLTKPVEFVQMGTNDVIVETKIVFFLGLNKGEGQVELLQYLIDCCMKQDFMERLRVVTTTTSFLEAL